MARTPIPPNATAARKRSKSERRSRCAILTFSCFFPLETGTAGLVLTARIVQRYLIFTRSATPPERDPCHRDSDIRVALTLWSTQSMAGILLHRGVRFVRPQ